MSPRKRGKRGKRGTGRKSGDGRGAFTVSAVIAMAVIVGAGFALYRPFRLRGNGLQGAWVVDVDATRENMTSKKGPAGEGLAGAFVEALLAGLLDKLEFLIDDSTIEVKFLVGKGSVRSQKKRYTPTEVGTGRYRLATTGKDGEEPEVLFATVQGDRMTLSRKGEGLELVLSRKSSKAAAGEP